MLKFIKEIFFGKSKEELVKTYEEEVYAVVNNCSGAGQMVEIYDHEESKEHLGIFVSISQHNLGENVRLEIYDFKENKKIISNITMHEATQFLKNRWILNYEYDSSYSFKLLVD